MAPPTRPQPTSDHLLESEPLVAAFEGSIPIPQISTLDRNDSEEVFDFGPMDRDRRCWGDGEDEIKETKKRDLWGFFCYSFAVEVFAIVSLTLFLPITLEQFARDNGRLLPDLQFPCPSSTSNTTIPISNSTLADVSNVPQAAAACAVKLFGVWVDTASFSLFVYSISVACQALVVVTMGDAADEPKTRRILLLAFAAAGSGATMLFFFLSSSSFLWPAAGLLATVANVGFGASFVCLNSFLPTLARGSPKVLEAHSSIATANPSSLPQAKAHHASLVSSTTASISAKGIALGYLSGITALVVALVPVSMAHGGTWGLRVAIGGVGFGGLCLRFKKDKFRAAESWRSVGRLLREYRKLPNTFWFLLAWFLLSDAFTTITSTAILFAKTTLLMPPTSLILIGILTPFSGILGALLWPKLQSRIPYLSSEANGAKGNLRVLGVLVGCAWLIPVYGCLGFVWGKGGLSTPGEMYFFAVYFGAVYGAFQSYARTVFAGLIPPGQEAKFYALYSITDKSSSFFGPLIVGILADQTHNIRTGFIFIAVVLLVPMPILSKLIDMEKGREDAEVYAKEVRERR